MVQTCLERAIISAKGKNGFKNAKKVGNFAVFNHIKLFIVEKYEVYKDEGPIVLYAERIDVNYAMQ